MPLASFESMLDAITDAGYCGRSLAEALADPVPNQVAITFDDGTRGQFDFAVPALRGRGMTATFYVTTDWVGTPGYMTWDELRQLTSCGMSVQSHTRSHPLLSQVDAARLHTELFDSKAAIDRELTQDTTEIALPGGDLPPRSLRGMLVEGGYRTVVGTRWGTNSGEAPRPAGFNPIRRCTVRGLVTAEWTRRVIRGDPLLGLAHGGRESVLRRLRSTLGANRYARWRRVLLDAVSRR